MKLLIGLGNPGTKYLKNRHNAGHMLVDRMENGELRIENVKALKTNTFMNESGVFVKKVSRTQNLEPSNLYIAHDDLDLKLGSYKIQFGKGPELHYGIQSIENELGTKDFWRIRIGVDNRESNNRIPGDQYVLLDFTHDELIILEKVYEEIRNHFSQYK